MDPKRVIFLVAVWWLVISRAEATLTYDLRLLGGDKELVGLTVGQVIDLELFAVVTGAANDSDPEGFQYGYVSVLSGNGGNIRGNLVATLTTVFAASGSQPGKHQDLDGDGDFDLGSSGTTADSNFLLAKASSMRTAGTAVPDGREFKLADLTFRVTSILNADDPSGLALNVFVPNFSSPDVPEAKWQEDGVVSSASGLTPGGTFPNSFPAVGAPVYLYAVPEPAPAGLLAIGLLSAAFRRHRSYACS